MNHNLELKIQAYLDGELAARDCREIEALIEKDAEAGALFEELSVLHSILAENEPVLALPESREFFWSKVERGIQTAEPVTTPSRRELPWWVRILAPVATAAALVVVLSLTMQPDKAPTGGHAQTSFDLPGGGFTFYAPDEDMTVVWVETGVN